MDNRNYAQHNQILIKAAKNFRKSMENPRQPRMTNYFGQIHVADNRGC